jgi:Icc-related predicted phosphoesterase
MKNNFLNDHLRFFPSVFALKDCYQIIVVTKEETVASIRIDDRVYYDETNGILRSQCYAHKIEIPMDVLDKACEYTVITRKVIDRSEPHRPITEALPDATFNFKPATNTDKLNIYHLADVHNYDDVAIKAGAYFGDALDVLVLNGDIPNHCGRAEKFDTVYNIISELTHGERPCVFARGNHDARGAAAERFGEYTPTSNGKTYYTFRLGSLWGMVLDCGEDKPDDHVEYGGTTCFHAFRQRETDFIKSVIKNAESEYLADGVKYKIIISHVPFTYVHTAPFDIEQDIYGEWARMLREHIKPDLTLHGHLHIAQIWYPGDKHDHLGQPCPAVIGSAIRRWTEMDGDMKRRYATFTGCALTVDINMGTTHIVFNDDSGNIVGTKDI